jgi:hypothetical protein
MSREYKNGNNLKVEVFHVRLMHRKTVFDTNKLNNFLSSVNVKQIYTDIVLGKVDYYAYSIRYIEKQNVELKEKRKNRKPDLPIN